ncbi:MAG: hypothetical protein JNK82_22775 [Myxococcaceae bacterium]|nr:hypothetical protein [Myxococcaceae bacterium]
MRPCISFALVLLVASPALAQRVVILEIEGDKGGKLRSQVESALKKADTVEVVPLDKYKAAAAKKKLKGQAAMTPAGLSRVAKALKIDAGVGGEIGKKFDVQIWDSGGQQLWTKELKVKGGLLSADFAGKLAKAITAAAQSAPKADEETEGEGDAESTPPKKEEEKPVAEETSTPPPPPKTTDEDREKRRSEEAAEEAAARSVEPERDQDLEQEGKKIKGRIGPKGISLWLAGTTTWRYYCARPGVDSCGAYDRLVEQMMTTPPGDVVDFRPQVPYAGFNFQVELFPLAWFLDNALQGIGAVGSFGLGFSLTRVTIQSPAGSTMPKEVVSTDRSWTAMLAYRFYFSFDSTAKNPAVGYVGVRGGVAGRIFEIDAKAMVPLPGTNRLYPAIGLDAAIPIIRYFNVELAASYFFSPRPGPDEIVGYGDPVNGAAGGASATGFQLEGGFAGTIWGPVGYRLAVRYTPFTDRYFGRGNKWTYTYPDGTEYQGTQEGAAFESYITFIWGITASF